MSRHVKAISISPLVHKNLFTKANTSLLSICRPKLDTEWCEKTVIKGKEHKSQSQKKQCRWLDTWRRFFISPSDRKKRKNQSANASTSQIYCCRPTLGSRWGEKKVVANKEQLKHSRKNECRLLDTWRRFRMLPSISRKIFCTCHYLPAKLL